MYPSHWSSMRTFGVRTYSRLLLLVVSDPKETLSATELERVPAYAPPACVGHYSWHCRDKHLSRRHPLPRFHYHGKSSLFSDHYRCHHLLRAHPSPSSLLCRHVATPMPVLVRFCLISTHPTTAAVVFQTACFAVTIVFSRPPLFYPFRVDILLLLVVLLATVSFTVTVDVFVAPP